MDQLWMIVISSLITGITGNISVEFDGDVLDTIAEGTILVKQWKQSDHISITISRNKSIRLSAFFFKNTPSITKDIRGVIMLNMNNSTRETSLTLNNVSKKDEGLYSVEEQVSDAKLKFPHDTVSEWIFKLNVIDLQELHQCNVSGSFSKTINLWPKGSRIYHYDKLIGHYNESGCHLANHFHLHGRLRCTNKDGIHTIIIKNVTQRDSGLYTVINHNNDIERFYLNLTVESVNITIGENATIDWFYSQQGMNRTLQIVHPNDGILMALAPNNTPKIMPAFQDRILYNGDISISYMSLILLNVGKSDSGIFRIKTLRGIAVPGCKHLIVHGVVHTASETTESTNTLLEYTTSDLRFTRENETSDSILTRESSLVPETIKHEDYNTSPLFNVRLTSPANVLVTSNDMNTGRKETSQALHKPTILIDIKYVVIGAIGLIILMTGSLTMIHKRNVHNMKAVKRFVLNASSSAPSLVTHQQPTMSVAEERRSRLIHPMPAGNDNSVFQYSAILDSSRSFDAQSSPAISVLTLKDVKPGLTRRMNGAPSESFLRPIENLSNARDNNMHGHLGDGPSMCRLDSAENNTAVGLCQPVQCRYDLYAKVNKGPRSTSTITKTIKTNYDRDGKKDDPYETCRNIIELTSMEHVMVLEDESVVEFKDQKPKKGFVSHDAVHTDYANIDI